MLNIPKGIHMKKLTCFFVLFCVKSGCFAQSNHEVINQAKELIRSMCLVGSGYDMSIGANGEISISKLGADGEVRFSKREIEGVVDVPGPDKHEELNSIRECTKPFIPKLLDILLKDAVSVIRGYGTSETLVRSRYLTNNDMKKEGCEQAEQDAINRVSISCSSGFYGVKLISCRASGHGPVTTFDAVIEGKCKESA